MKLRLAAIAAATLNVSTTANALAAAAPPASATVVNTAAEPAVLESAGQAAKAAENWELKGESSFTADENRRRALENASTALTQYVNAHPNDVRALLLQARVLRALILVTPVAIKLEGEGGRVTEGDMSKQQAAGLAALDKAIALEPGNAEAFYWKSRMLSLRNAGAEQVGAETPYDPKPALEAARKAVSLAPADARYREYLALQLFGIGQRAEALDELRKLPARHPILQLVDDLDAVPAPPNAQPDEERAYNIVSNIFPGSMDAFPYPGIRAKAYAVSSPQAEIQAFYTRSWPRIRWVKQKAEGGSVYAAALLWRQDKLEPADDPGPFMADLEEKRPPSGVLIVVSRDDKAKPAHTVLYVVNFRQF